MIEKIAVLDGHTRSALAATRSLGKRGLHVVVAGETRKTLSGWSKYCSETFTYPPPREQAEAFVAAVKAQCLQHGIGVIFPMTEPTTTILLQHRERFEGFKIPFVELDTFEALTNKWKLFQLAQQLKISIPKTHFIRDAQSLQSVYPGLRFPAVLKPYRSTVNSKGRLISTSVKYACSVRELEEIVAQHEYFERHPFLIQEYVSGHAEGIFALYDHGRPLAWFAHRRLRERPPRGGVSVLCESIEPNSEARKIAQTLLDHVKWHGVAMVEFKVSPEGTPYLMEVNGRFWGSLQLAVDAGVDFPWLLYQLATGRPLDQVDGYAAGAKCRWLLGDLARLFRVLSGEKSPSGLTPMGRLRSVLQFANFFDPSTRYEINRWDDLKPFLFELSQSVWHRTPTAVNGRGFHLVPGRGFDLLPKTSNRERQ